MVALYNLKTVSKSTKWISTITYQLQSRQAKKLWDLVVDNPLPGLKLSDLQNLLVLTLQTYSYLSTFVIEFVQERDYSIVDACYGVEGVELNRYLFSA